MSISSMMHLQDLKIPSEKQCLSRTPVKYCPFPLLGEGGTLNCAPSADAVAGNGWDGRAEAGTDAASYAGPHPHPCPPPSRGRESARTGSQIAYLTNVV